MPDVLCDLCSLPPIVTAPTSLVLLAQGLYACIYKQLLMLLPHMTKREGGGSMTGVCSLNQSAISLGPRLAVHIISRHHGPMPAVQSDRIVDCQPRLRSFSSPSVCPSSFEIRIYARHRISIPLTTTYVLAPHQLVHFILPKTVLCRRTPD